MTGSRRPYQQSLLKCAAIRGKPLDLMKQRTDIIQYGHDAGPARPALFRSAFRIDQIIYR